MNDPAFLFYPGDYLRDTQCLSEQAQVAYDRIMCEHMRNICITQDRLNFFIKRLTADQKQEVMSVLSKIDGGFEISWVSDSLRKRREYSESRRKNRTSTKKTSSTYVEHMENEDVIVSENENEIEEWGVWGAQIVNGEDFGWENMKGRKVSSDEMDIFLSVAVRNKWKMVTQQEFRTSLKGFKPNAYKNGNETKRTPANAVIEPSPSGFGKL